LPSNSLCFDIGANVGDKAGVFLKLNAKVICIEPQQRCAEMIKLKYGNKVTVLQNGVGAKREIKEFYISNNSQLSSFDSEWIGDFKDNRFGDYKVIETGKIEIITLDDLITEFGKPDFIKIDVEGYELEVLMGLNKNFTMLSFEYSVPEKVDAIVNCLITLQNKFSNLNCNYALENYSSKFEINKWLTVGEMLAFIKQQQFLESFAGDIYIKQA
jgi:FkbM family methyltransferase